MGSPALAPTDLVSTESAVSVPHIAIENRPTLISSPISKRIPALDGLRGVAILLVLLRHSVAGTETSSRFWSAVLAPLRLSWSGVDLFFVLSGFLIGGILLDARNSPKYFRTFYLRRTFRILPVYYIFLLLYFARHLPFHFLPGALANTSPLPIPFLSFVTFTHNFWMVSFGWFGAWGIAPTWSLAIEEQFYVTVPFLIRKLAVQSLYIALGSIIVGASILRSVLPHIMQHGAFANYVLMPCRSDALSMGVLAALLYRSPKFNEWLRRRSWILYSITAAAFAVITFLTFFALDQYSSPMATWGLSCLGVFYACILLLVVCGLNGTLDRVLRFGPLMKLGTIAYCTYLVHAPLMQLARALLRGYGRMSPATGWSLGGVLGIVMAVLVASLSWKLLEQRLISYGHRFNY